MDTATLAGRLLSNEQKYPVLMFVDENAQIVSPYSDVNNVNLSSTSTSFNIK